MLRHGPDYLVVSRRISKFLGGPSRIFDSL
jgi:hypothetical protein